MTRKRLVGWVSALVILAALTLAALNTQAIADWWYLRSYQPVPAIAALSEDALFTQHAQRLFYLSDPQLQPKSEFNDSCVFSEFSIVVGCFDGEQIYILDITNKEVEAGEIVTAAHEMLHAAYQRFSSPERQRIDQLVLEEAKDVTDPNVLKTMSLYESESVLNYPNELHSLLGTEVEKLSEELEVHYQQYFTDRLALVAIAQAYAEVFAELESQAESLASELNELAKIINRESVRLDVAFAALERERLALQARVDSGEQGESLDADIAAYQARADAYNIDVSELNSLIDHYQTLKKRYDKVALRHEELVKSIDSHYQADQIEE